MPGESSLPVSELPLVSIQRNVLSHGGDTQEVLAKHIDFESIQREFRSLIERS